MRQRDIEEKLASLLKLAKELSEAPIPVVKQRAEMVIGLFEELMVTVVGKPNTD